MSFLKKNKDIIFICFSIIVLFISTFFNFAAKTAQDGTVDFDIWSSGIMVSDMNYRENYEVDSLFLKLICPGMTMKDGTVIKSGQDVFDTYIANRKYDKSDYVKYCSSVTIHRYVYAFFDKILPFSNGAKINIFYMINALLLSISLTIIINWLKNNTNLIVGYITLFMISCFSPAIAMYGVNLYWVSWSLFLPMVASIFVIQSNYFSAKHRMHLYPMVVAFFVCALKQLLYFEFVSTVMIAMMVPYIFMCLDKKYSLKESIKVITYPTIGAILSFVFVSVVKFIMLIFEFSSIAEAKMVFFDAVSRRMTGDANSLAPEVVESTNASILKVFKIMGSKSAYSMKNVFNLSYFGIVCILVVIVIYVIYLYKRNKIAINDKLMSLMIITIVAFLAPISWFVLAKPHTYIHNVHSSITWFIPFMPLATAFIAYFITRIFTNTIFMKKINEV